MTIAPAVVTLTYKIIVNISEKVFLLLKCSAGDTHRGSGLVIYAFLHNFAISIDSSSPINKFDSFIIFSLLINGVILLLNCLILILYLYIHFFFA